MGTSSGIPVDGNQVISYHRIVLWAYNSNNQTKTARWQWYGLGGRSLCSKHTKSSLTQHSSLVILFITQPYTLHVAVYCSSLYWSAVSRTGVSRMTCEQQLQMFTVHYVLSERVTSQSNRASQATYPTVLLSYVHPAPPHSGLCRRGFLCDC